MQSTRLVGWNMLANLSCLALDGAAQTSSAAAQIAGLDGVGPTASEWVETNEAC